MAQRDRAEYMRRYRAKRTDRSVSAEAPAPRHLDDRSLNEGIARMTQKKRDAILRKMARTKD